MNQTSDHVKKERERIKSPKRNKPEVETGPRSVRCNKLSFSY